MNVTIAFIDLFTASMFIAAAVITIVTSQLARGRTRLWVWISLLFLLLGAQAGMNALEWTNDPQFAWMDAVDGYVGVLAALILIGVGLSFWRLAREAAAAK